MSWSPFWRLVELNYLDRGIPHSFEDLIEQDPRLEPHLIGAMAYWLWQYDTTAPSLPRSTGRLLWHDRVDTDLSFKYTEMAAYVGAYGALYPETVRPTVAMLYRMGGHPRLEPAGTAVEALAKLAAAGIVDTESLLAELALVLARATPRRQVLATHGLLTLKLRSDVSLGQFTNRFCEMLVADPTRRHVHSRHTACLDSVTVQVRKLHAVEAIALVAATEAVPELTASHDIAHLVDQHDWATLATHAIATVASRDRLPEVPADDVSIPAQTTNTHDIWQPVRNAVTAQAATRGEPYRAAAICLSEIVSNGDSDWTDELRREAGANTLGDEVAAHFEQESSH